MPKQKSMMTQKQYVAKGGNCCPKCGGGDLDSGTMQTDSGIAWAYVTCHTCETCWTENYSLTGFTPRTMGDKPTPKGVNARSGA